MCDQDKMNRIVPAAKTGNVISFRVQNLTLNTRKIVKQIETPRFVMRSRGRLRAGREEERVADRAT